MSGLTSGAPGTNQTPLLTWTAAPHAATYVIDFGLEPGCENVANNVPVSGTSYRSPMLEDGDYCWRVASVDAHSIQSAFSADSNFTSVPTFGQWGMLFLIASMGGVGFWYMRRRRE